MALTRSRVLRLACYWTRDESPALPAWATDTFGEGQSTPFGSPEWRGGAVVPTKETQGAVTVSQRSKGQQYLSELNATKWNWSGQILLQQIKPWILRLCKLLLHRRNLEILPNMLAFASGLVWFLAQGNLLINYSNTKRKWSSTDSSLL